MERLGQLLAFSTPINVGSRLHTVSGTVANSAVTGCGQMDRVRRTRVVTMGPWKKGEKDEAFQQQQEILERRRNKKKNNEHFESIEQRRQSIQEYYEKRKLKVPNGEDPIIAWKKMKDEGLIDESQYTEFDEGGIPIPMASFGIPKYDNGGRFDLRLPHVEVGYTDEDADVMGRAGKALKNMFGFGKKKEEEGKEEFEKNTGQ